MEYKKLPTFTREQVAEHRSESSARIIINNLIYDVTDFLRDHPGGIEVILERAGYDVSSQFYQVGHSDIALQWREKFLVGAVVNEEHRKDIKRYKKFILPPSHTLRAVPDYIIYGQLGIVIGIIAIIILVVFFF